MSGIILEVVGMIFVIINMNIVMVSKLEIINVICLFELGGKKNDNSVNVVKKGERLRI